MRRRSGGRAARRGARIRLPSAAGILSAVDWHPGSPGSPKTPGIFDRLADRPLLAWCFDLLWDAGCRPVVVAAPPALVANAQAELGDRAIVMSATRDRRSTMLGALTRVTGERVVVLDYTYPLATVDEVRAVIEGLDEADACVVAIPAMETLKLVKEGVVQETVDRAEMWHQQMPLGFRTATLSSAHRGAAEAQEAEAVEKRTETGDDVGTVERFGGKVVIVPGSRSNIRITTAEDLKLAHALVGREQ